MNRESREDRDEGVDLRRNCLTIRFKDAEHQAVTDEAWRNRKTASGWMRELVMEHLDRRNILNVGTTIKPNI